jgi:ubiquitination network signaling protein AcrB
MGRSSAFPKRPPGTAANQHNAKHENGIVGPGKRIQKQKSNGHLNGHTKSSERPPSATPFLPATPPPTNGHARVPTEVAFDQKMATDTLRCASVETYSESSSSESYLQNGTTISLSQENHRRIDVNAAKNPAVHRDAGPMNFVLTVLRSCPLYDTIAILIVLLQIPPAFLSVIHILFASLTFVPPSTSTHSSFSFTDIFEGTLGTPSVATIIAVDLLVLLLWLFLWSPLQDIAIDLAQTVIALTLGGGTSGRDAGFNNVLVCLGIIGVSHLARSGSIKHPGLRMLLPASRSDPEDPSEPAPQTSKKGPHVWLNTILAIHILTQGVVRYIRDWYVRRERRDSMLSSLGDPEAAKGSMPENAINESASNTPNTMTPDVDSLGSFPISNVMDKTLNPKKKRKASAQVRIRQPLWAALASTKIVMAKEYETSRTAAESAGTNATDINNLGNAPFDAEADRIWITYVGFDQVCFNTSYFPSHMYADTSQGHDEVPDSPGVDKSKPFFVRVNKTTWQPTRIHAITNSSPSNADLRWGGEIFGLAPMSSYECEFVSTADGSTIFTTSIRTMHAPTADTATSSAVSPSIQRPARPDSPTTTLKTSIATAEAKLTEERNRQKRERKEQKTKTNATRKEIDKLSSNIASSGGNDDRLRQKIQQSNLHAKQADDAVAHLTEQLEILENLPDDDLKKWAYAKSAWHAQKDMHKTSRSEFHEAKVTAERLTQALTADVATLQQKCERMQSRINKLNGEHERITDANARGLDEAQRKASERAAKEAERVRTEMMYMERLDMFGPQIQEMERTLRSVWANIHAIQQVECLAAQAQAQAQQSPSASAPNLNPYDIPEGIIPNTPYPWNPTNFIPSYGAPSVNPLNSQQGHRTRGRSSSMLSNVSGFTQSSVDEPPLPRDAQVIIQRERQKSDGGSSGSGTSGSVGDPKSPGQAKWGSWDEK